VEVIRITVRGTNCYVLRAQGGSLLIDPGPPGGEARIVDFLNRRGITGQEIRLILVTHAHLDHYGAASNVQSWSGAPIGCHPESVSLSQDARQAIPPAQTLRGSLVRWISLLLAPLRPHPPLRADVILPPGTELGSYGVDGRLVAVPGHSPDSLALISAEGDAFVGDLIINYSVPSQPLYQWNRDAWQQSRRLLASIQPRTVYVGHGEPFPGQQMDRILPARYQLGWWIR
jgi:glyoxylase-like metal-dependent hydrolase (beta-lactamase superfamily II)